jgi:Spy/CpxP family protein refolding chaperone
MGAVIMERESTPTRIMKLIAFVVLLTALCPRLAAAADPFAGALFPPELVLLARDHIALTPEQREALHARMEQTKSRSDELRAKLERETATLATLAKQEHVDEASLVAQLDKVLDVEREVKHLHLGTVVAIKNLLTPEQQTKLREIAKNGGAQLMEEARQRLSKKVERIQEGARQWADSGRDPSVIAQAMQEKFKPLIEAGKIVGAEAELDRLLEQLDNDAK